MILQAELWNTSLLWITLWKNLSLSLDNTGNALLTQVLRIICHISILIICQPRHIIICQKYVDENFFGLQIKTQVLSRV